MTRFHFERPDGPPNQNAQNILIPLNEFVPPQGYGGGVIAVANPLLALYQPIGDNTFQFFKFYQINRNQAIGAEVNKPLKIKDTLPPGVLQEASGNDIRAFNSSGVPIPYQYLNVTINPDTSADILIRINMPLVKVGEFVQLAFGKPTATDGQSTDTWNSNYLAALPLNEVPGGAGSMKDATGNGNDGTPINSPTQVNGLLGKALQFDASSMQYVDIPTISISDTITVEITSNTVDASVDQEMVMKNPVNTQWRLFFENNLLKWKGGLGTDTLDNPNGIANDSLGNIYVSGIATNNVFKITPDGGISVIIDATGDGTNTLGGPRGVTVDSLDNVYVVGTSTNNAFKITPAGIITQIIDSTGDGTNVLDSPFDVTVDSSDNVYVAGTISDNVFKITPLGVITEIIDSTGDGVNVLDTAFGVATDLLGNVFVTGRVSDNAFKITPSLVITEIIDGDGAGIGEELNDPRGIATDSLGNVFLVGFDSDNAFKITPGGTITEIIDVMGDGIGNTLDQPFGVATDSSNNVYVSGANTNNVFKITPALVITEIINLNGDGTNLLITSRMVTVDSSSNVYVAGGGSDNAFKITPSLVITEIIDATGNAASIPIICTPPTNNNFHKIVATQSGTTIEISIDGKTCAVSDIGIPIGNGAGTVNIARFDNSFFFNGILGEMIISDIKLTPDWIETSANNELDNDKFWFKTPILENNVDNFWPDGAGDIVTELVP